MSKADRMDQILRQSAQKALFRCMECRKTLRILLADLEKAPEVICTRCETPMIRYPCARREH